MILKFEDSKTYPLFLVHKKDSAVADFDGRLT